jgi:alkylation response protein AidB-like acyl-CoA dehydrogenase
VASDHVTASVDDAGIEQELEAWLQRNWDPALSVTEWWERVGDAGWTAPHFPLEWGGRGYTRRAQVTVHRAFRSFGALPPPSGLGMMMAAPTIHTHGTPDQIERHVTPVYRGTLAWCQLFSEPGSGSDLAGLTTRATRDGDHWVISGQKVWSSQAMEADYGMLMARTDFDAPKHAGISWFALPLDQPGVTIRPLREMTGRALFNEVFFDDAIVDDADLIGGLNNGWAVANTTLLFERTGIGAGGGVGGFPMPGTKGGLLELRAGDATKIEPPEHKQLVVSELLALAREYDRADDPFLRQKLAQVVSLSRIGEWTATRMKAEAARGRDLTGVANMAKNAQTIMMKLGAETALDILGAEGLLWGADAPDDGRYAELFNFVRCMSIAGGSDEINKNVIGERGLGLPREPNPDKGLPFREVLARTKPAST